VTVEIMSAGMVDNGGHGFGRGFIHRLGQIYTDFFIDVWVELN